MSSQKSTWFNDSFLALLMTLMRFAWIWPWFELVRGFLSPQHMGELLAPWQLIVLPLTAFGLTRFVAGETGDSGNNPNQAQEAPALAGRLLVALLGIVAMMAVLWWQLYAATYAWWDSAWLQALGEHLIRWDLEVGLPAAVVAILALSLLWLNGLRDAVRAMTHDDIWSTLRTGIIALALYLILRSRSAVELPPMLLQQVLLLFTAGMIALAVTSLKITIGLDRALGMGQRRVSAAPVVSRYWLVSVTVTVLLLLAIGLVVGFLLAPDQLARLLALVQLALNAIGRAIGAVLLMVGYVLFLIAYYIGLLLAPLIRRLFPGDEDRPPMEFARMPESGPALEEVIANPTVIPDLYRWIALGIFAVIVLLLFALAVRRLRATPAAEIDETRESILTTDLLQAQLGNLWNRLFGRRQGQQDIYLSLDGEAETRQRIRAAYQQLLAAATTLGQARRPGATPTEYQSELQLPSGEVTTPLAALTAAYHQARYATEPPTPAEAAAAQQAWQQIQDEIQAQQTAAPSSEA